MPAQPDHYLTRKARACWRHAVVLKGSDGGFTLLKRDGTPPVRLSDPIRGWDGNATFHAARARLYALRREAGLAKGAK